MDKGKTYIVRAFVERPGYHAPHDCDLIFPDGTTPTLVFEWAVAEEGFRPIVAVHLDPASLRQVKSPEVDYIYEHPVRDPRKIS